MAFTELCFIRRNTEELRGHLTDTGHREIKSISKNKGDKKYLYTCCGKFSQENEHFIKCLKDYNCETNESLFKAIAALNDETDYMQWFVKDNEWLLCDRDDWDDCISDLTVGKKFSSNEQRGEWLDHLESFYKATVEELIEHFK